MIPPRKTVARLKKNVTNKKAESKIAVEEAATEVHEFDAHCFLELTKIELDKKCLFQFTNFIDKYYIEGFTEKCSVSMRMERHLFISRK